MMNEIPLVSVITPTFNHEKFIAECIESILAQTYENWEMIILDDASEDNTYHIAKSFANKDRRIKVYKHEKNYGIRQLYKTYNELLANSCGKYIAILEGDDIALPERLMSQVSCLENATSEYILSYGDAIISDGETEEEWLVSKKVKKITDLINKDYYDLENEKYGMLNLFLRLYHPFANATVTVKRTFLERIGGFLGNEHTLVIDYPTWIIAAFLGKFCYVSDKLVIYRKHLNSETVCLIKEDIFKRIERLRRINLFIRNNIKIIIDLDRYSRYIDIDIEELTEQNDKYLSKKLKCIDYNLSISNLRFNNYNIAFKHLIYFLSSLNNYFLFPRYVARSFLLIFDCIFKKNIFLKLTSRF